MSDRIFWTHSINRPTLLSDNLWVWLHLTMNLEHHSSTNPATSEISRVFEDSCLLQTGDLIDSSPYEHALEETQAVRSHFALDTHIAPPPNHAPARPQSSRPQAVAYRASIALGGIALLFLSLAIGSPTQVQSVPDRSVQSPFEARQRLEEASLAAITASKTADIWSGESKYGARYVAQVSALKTSGMVSVRLSVRGTLPESDTEFTLRRAETDPAILAEVEPGKWSAAVPLYLFLSRGDQFTSVVGEARISISGADAPIATLEVAYPGAPKPEALAASHALQVSPHAAPFALNFTESIKLGLTNEPS